MSKKVLKNLGDLGGILPTSMHSGCYREQRKSVDYYTDKYNVENELENLRERTTRYGLDLINEEEWTRLIVSRYTEINQELQTFKANLVMAAQREYLSPVEELIKDLLDYKDELEQRAMDEANNGAFSKCNLHEKASFYVPVDNTELPETENVFIETTDSVQTQIGSDSHEQACDDQVVEGLDTIDPDVLTYQVQTVNSNGMNDTLSTPMTDGAIEFLNHPEHEDIDINGSVKKLRQTVKDLLIVSNKNVNFTNGKYDEMTKFKQESTSKVTDMEQKIQDLTLRANKPDDSLNSVLG